MAHRLLRPAVRKYGDACPPAGLQLQGYEGHNLTLFRAKPPRRHRKAEPPRKPWVAFRTNLPKPQLRIGARSCATSAHKPNGLFGAQLFLPRLAIRFLGWG